MNPRLPKFLKIAAAALFSALLLSGHPASADSEIVIEGRLSRETIEGGFWTLQTNDGKLYDLHGNVPFQDGDHLRAKGITPQGISCIHMKGTIFIPVSMERIESAPAPPPGSKQNGVWKLEKDTAACYGPGGDILRQESKVKYFLSSQDGRTCLLVKHFDPKGGKKMRDYAVALQDANPVIEFYDVPLAVSSRAEDVPVYLTLSGRFGWIQNNGQTIFFDTWTKKQQVWKGECYAEINESGAYKVWGMKFGKSYTLLRQEGKFE